MSSVTDSEVSSYQSDIERYIAKNRHIIGRFFDFDSSKLSDSDIRIFCNYLSYRAGEPHYVSNHRSVDPGFIDDVRIKPASMKTESELVKALFWYERGMLTQNRLPDSMVSIPDFSDAINEKLEVHRERHFRESFEKLADGVGSIAASVRGLRELMSSTHPADSDEFRSRLKECCENLRNSIASCDYHARSGVSWAVRQNIPFDKARNAVYGVYLRHLPAINQAIEPIREFLETQGIDFSLTQFIDRKQQTWSRELTLSRIHLQNQGYPVKSDPAKDPAVIRSRAQSMEFS